MQVYACIWLAFLQGATTMKVMNILFSLFLLFVCQPSLGFEIPYLGEDGFFVGVPLNYVLLDTKTQEMRQGTFVFGETKISIDGEEYYDCVFKTESTTSHFYFGLNRENKTLMLKGLTTGTAELIIEPAVSIIRYPVSPDSKWEEQTIILGKNIEIPNLGVLPSLSIEDVRAQTTAAAVNIAVPAGSFSVLCIETNFAGNVLNIPLTLIHRTWLSQENIVIRRTIDFLFMGRSIPLLDMQLQELWPSSCEPGDKLVQYWGAIKTK